MPVPSPRPYRPNQGSIPTHTHTPIPTHARRQDAAHCSRQTRRRRRRPSNTGRLAASSSSRRASSCCRGARASISRPRARPRRSLRTLNRYPPPPTFLSLRLARPATHNKRARTWAADPPRPTRATAIGRTRLTSRSRRTRRSFRRSARSSCSVRPARLLFFLRRSRGSCNLCRDRRMHHCAFCLCLPAPRPAGRQTTRRDRLGRPACRLGLRAVLVNPSPSTHPIHLRFPRAQLGVGLPI
jgi:hypothetical protein